MKGFGEAIHCSVFRCDLTPKGRMDMVVAISELIQPDVDRVMIIDLGPVDGKVAERIEFLGVHTKEPPRGAIIV